MTTKCLVFSLWLQLFLGFGLWNLIKCDCPIPEDEIINGRYIFRTPIDPKFSTAPERYLLIFRCNAGYKLIGAKRIQCLEGKWSNKVPSCKEMPCTEPPLIANGAYDVNAVDKTEITIGMQAIYSCEPGYELGDPSVSTLTCILNEDGDDTLWAGDVPFCKAIKPCSDPGFSMTGSRKGDCCLPGDIVSYSCNEGFEMVGEKDIECLLSSRWSSPRPLCRPLGKHCELPPEVPNGVVLRKSGDYALPKEDVEIICKPGYKYNGPDRLPYCNKSALWTVEFGECEEITCDHPEPLANGNIPELEKFDFNDTFPNNFLLTYDCKEGYRLKGTEAWRICETDGWSGAVPYCEEIYCPDPGAPEQGSRLGDSFKVGAKVRFKCFTGYDLLGSLERYCKPNGKWSGKLTRCNAPTNHCPNPGIPINGIRNGEKYNEGDTVEFSCRSGFIQVGSKEITCMADRKWNGTETKCLGPHDYDSTENIGEQLKNRLDAKFDEQWRAFKLRLSAEGLTGEDGRLLGNPPGGRLIMYFAFDGSGSIGKENFNKGIKFAKAIVRKIGVSENGSRVGAAVFSNVPDMKFFPMDYKNTTDVLDKLDEIEYTKGGTSVTAALELIINSIKLEEAQKDFVNKTKKTVLFLITDGKANMDGSPEKEADLLKDKMNVEIFCIGITGDVRTNALYEIASTSTYGNEQRENVFILKNYERLEWLVQDLTNGTIDYSQCGLGMESKLGNNEGRMIDGAKSLEPWPWMAALFFKDVYKRNGERKLTCGGSIINENFILTAAHCMYDTNLTSLDFRERNAEEITVKLGLVVLDNTTYVQVFHVAKIFIHEKYKHGKNFDYDIALLKVNEPITFSLFIRPVCLPPDVLSEDPKDPLYKHDEYGWVIGFGHDKRVPITDQSTEFTQTNELKELKLLIQPDQKCITSLRQYAKSFTEHMFCAGSGTGGNDTCKGDSGGPFMQHSMNSKGDICWTQVGIVSWGKGCGVIGQYGYYTKVHRFRTWIDEKINEDVLKQKDV